jgi:hypothetical protein
MVLKTVWIIGSRNNVYSPLDMVCTLKSTKLIYKDTIKRLKYQNAIYHFLKRMNDQRRTPDKKQEQLTSEAISTQKPSTEDEEVCESLALNKQWAQSLQTRALLQC